MNKQRSKVIDILSEIIDALFTLEYEHLQNDISSNKSSTNVFEEM
ncbi:hypothetical protein [Salipaludibacillus daqingensis]|nr:hypothetical protein [Salipaludibacillus daqingensis]